MEIVSLKQAKRLILIIIGFTVLLFGVALLVLPGPGIPFLIIGLSMLAAQFLWARRLLDRIKKETGHVKNRFKRDFKKARNFVN